jgi:hypothetical protein
VRRGRLAWFPPAADIEPCTGRTQRLEVGAATEAGPQVHLQLRDLGGARGAVRQRQERQLGALDPALNPGELDRKRLATLGQATIDLGQKLSLAPRFRRS